MVGIIAMDGFIAIPAPIQDAYTVITAIILVFAHHAIHLDNIQVEIASQILGIFKIIKLWPHHVQIIVILVKISLFAKFVILVIF
jgi:hypothetical protein